MAEELAELFGELAAHRLIGLQARFGVVTSVDATTVMVQLDSDSAPIGPWPVIRGLPSVGQKVTLFAVPGTRGYVVVGRAITFIAVCPDPATKCLNWHWPPDTVVGTYTLAADEMTGSSGGDSHDETHTQSIGPGTSSTNGQHFTITVPSGEDLLTVTMTNPIPSGSLSTHDADLWLFAPGNWAGELSEDAADAGLWERTSQNNGMEESVFVASPVAGVWDIVVTPFNMVESTQYDLNIHYESGVVDTYTHDRVVLTLPVTAYRDQLVELVSSEVAGPWLSVVQVRVYCPNGWTGDPDTSAPPVFTTTGTLYNYPIDPGSWLRSVWNPSSIDGDWTVVVDGSSLPASATFTVNAFGAECCDAPSDVVFEQHVDIPPDVPHPPYNELDVTKAWIAFPVTIPEGVTSYTIEPIWDDPASLAPYTWIGGGITINGFQVHLFEPGAFTGKWQGHLVGLDTWLFYDFGVTPADAVPSTPFLYDLDSGAEGFYFRDLGGAILFRQDFPAGDYTAFFGTTGWSNQPPFTVGVSLRVTLHFCNAANDSGGYGPS